MKKKDNMPGFVYIGLLGINSRTMAYFFVILSLVLAAGCLVYAFTNPDPVYYTGLFFIPAAYWYYYCIKWVDQNSSWES